MYDGRVKMDKLYVVSLGYEIAGHTDGLTFSNDMKTLTVTEEI